MSRRPVYKVVWQTNDHSTFAPYAADVLGYDNVVQMVTGILASGDLMHLRVEWKSWELKAVA